MSQYLLSPATASHFLQRLSLRILNLLGWKVLSAPMPGPRGVVIVYPHTSNWDFIIGVLAKGAIGLPFKWLGKEALFKGVCGATLGHFFRYIGGEPVERATATGAIERIAQRMRESDWFWLALAPEGTRKFKPSWRSGFYHIALAADVPLAMASFDYRTRTIRLVDFMQLSGDAQQDMAHIRTVYADIHGLKPECAAPIELAEAGDSQRSQGQA